MPEAFLDEAVRFANDQMWGTLAASVTVPRGFQAARLDTAIGQLRYGVVGINQWPGVAFALMSPPWGAFPGSDLRDVQSGIGCVHNTYLLGPVSKTVLRGPLAMTPKPIWFSTHHHPVSVAWSLLHLYQRPSLGRLPRLLFQAMRG
jgi:acyl-CoA reductase-like NAD-dependent aldehyde dehydrogenase